MELVRSWDRLDPDVGVAKDGSEIIPVSIPPALGPSTFTLRPYRNRFYGGQEPRFGMRLGERK